MQDIVIHRQKFQLFETFRIDERNGDKYTERKESKYRKIISNMDLRQ